ncbi:MCE family protein [Tomitella fengzijianii]|uniref:MCE family protein n=1 Tax=Tomitella fengzijianii TaxID=2597660 RepID=A0A516X0P9_9ACTN|nr:MCE family protein [Tomitella fengzijianii]QDQ96610.1 MCE family protein [Tomitella fengzijianii]
MTRRPHNRRRGVLAAVAATVAAGMSTAACGPGLQDLPVGHEAEGDSYGVTAVFDHADRVMPGAPVRIGQLTVGRVHDLSTDGRAADVRLSLRSDVDIPADASAVIEVPSALGSPFVRIEPDGGAGDGPERGGERMLADGDTIPLARTRVGPELETSLATLGLLLNGSGLDQLQTVMAELDAAYGGRGGQVRGLIDDANTLLGDVDAQREGLDRTLAAMDSLTGTLAGHQDDIDRALVQAAPMATLLAAQGDRIADLVDSGADLAAHADALLSTSSVRIGAEIDQVSRILEALSGFNATDTDTLRSADEFIASFTSVIRGDYLLFDGALDIPRSLFELWAGERLPAASQPPPAAGGPR